LSDFTVLEDDEKYRIKKIFNDEDDSFENGSMFHDKIAVHRETEQKIFLRDCHTISYKEVNLLKCINGYPNAAEFYGYGRFLAEEYMYMEKLCISLNDICQLFQTWHWIFPERIARHVLSTLLKTLDYVHSHGYYNVYIHPKNVLFTRNGILKIVHFNYVEEINCHGCTRSLSAQLLCPPEIIRRLYRTCKYCDTICESQEKLRYGIDIWFYAINFLVSALLLNDFLIKPQKNVAHLVSIQCCISFCKFSNIF
jgi:serine/threonine protein kinase